MGHQTLQEESGSWGAVTLCCVHQNCRIVCTYRDLAAYIWNRAWCYYWAGLKNIMRGKGEFTHLVLFPKNDTRGARDCLPLWHLAGTQCNHHLSASLKQVISSSRWNSVQCTQQAESRDKRRSGEDLHKLCDRRNALPSESLFPLLLIQNLLSWCLQKYLSLALSIFIRQRNCPRNSQRVFLSSNCSQIVYYKASRFSFYTRRELQFCPSALNSKSSPLSLVQGIGLSKIYCFSQVNPSGIKLFL